MQDFRKVRAWESALLVAIKTRELVARFPRRGYTELREQMISAAESIGNNIAEGRAAESPKEFLRFLDMAARSASELSSQLQAAKAYRIVEPRAVFRLTGTVICTRRMIQSMQMAIHDDEDRAEKRIKRPRRDRPAKQSRKRPPKPGE